MAFSLHSFWKQIFRKLVLCALSSSFYFTIFMRESNFKAGLLSQWKNRHIAGGYQKMVDFHLQCNRIFKVEMDIENTFSLQLILHAACSTCSVWPFLSINSYLPPSPHVCCSIPHSLNFSFNINNQRSLI